MYGDQRVDGTSAFIFKTDKTGNVRATQQWGAFTKPLLPWKTISITYFCVCVEGGGWGWVHERGRVLPELSSKPPQAPYCLRPLSLHHICRHYVINGTIVAKKSLNIKCVFWFSLQLLFETFLILRRIQRDVINVTTSSCYFCRILMKLEFYRQISEKVPNIKFNQNPWSGSRVVPCGQTDGRMNMTKLIVAIHNFANAPKNAPEI